MPTTEQVLAQLIAPGASFRDGSDLWGALVERVCREKVRTVAEFEHLASTLEREYRKDPKASDSTMPVKYRSAKSVIAKALRRGVPLVDAAGRRRGKTAVEKDCKSWKSAV